MRNDTIVAQATPAGRGGIGIIRVSGQGVEDIITQVLKTTLTPRVASYLPFYAENNDVLDEGVAIYYPHPHSFTGEDVLELQGHGSPVVMDLLVKRIVKLGARVAKPGEFSERAFLNDKMDLTQAEAIADLIDAASQQAARSAMRSLQGEFARDIHDLNEKIIELRLYIEAAIDFSEEEIDFLIDQKINDKAHDILNQLTSIQHQSVQGNLLREGITAVIAGVPNVGKSSLLNCLASTDLAIVTDIPGTTRDVLRNHIQLDGMPMHVIDTAGLRESDDIIEQEGIKRAFQEMQKADVILYVMDACVPVSLPAEIRALSRPVIIVRNKIDLLSESVMMETWENHTVVAVSAKSGSGIDAFKNAIKKIAGFESVGEGIYLARRRHLDALARTQDYLTSAIEQLALRTGELAAEDLRQAHLALCEITGKFTPDDLLGRIFSSFCIGK